VGRDYHGDHEGVPWARATVTLYDPDVDGFRFYVVVIRLRNLPRIRTSRCLERFAAQQPEKIARPSSGNPVLGIMRICLQTRIPLFQALDPGVEVTRRQVR
jgi:hypothetical protein